MDAITAAMANFFWEYQNILFPATLIFGLLLKSHEGIRGCLLQASFW